MDAIVVCNTCGMVQQAEELKPGTVVQNDERLVAVIVFLASILIPIFKLLGLFFLVVTTKLNSARWQPERTWIYRIIEVIGPWAMLDVFLLAILVALVKLQQLATILPGRGLLAFTTVVVSTNVSTRKFLLLDPNARVR